MSPSESQLRAALQQGEGDAPDAGALISHAVAVRRERRHRITSIATGVAVVAVIGVGMTALVSSSQDSDSGGSSVAGGSATRPRAANAGGADAAGVPAESAAPRLNGSVSAAARGSIGTGAAAKAVIGLKCPAKPARYMLPGGGGSGQFGSGGPLFDSPVTAAKVCTYPQTASAHSQAHVYGTAAAHKIVAALESAPDQQQAASCAPNADYVGGTVEILAVDAKGNPMKPVVVTLECRASQATNGTAVRYVMSLPDELLQLVVGGDPGPPKKTMGSGSPTH
jgi:hypothetical protein